MMMSKIIIVDSCCGCPDFVPQNPIEGIDSFCNHHKTSGKIIDSLYLVEEIFPKWCPLESDEKFSKVIKDMYARLKEEKSYCRDELSSNYWMGYLKERTKGLGIKL